MLQFPITLIKVSSEEIKACVPVPTKGVEAQIGAALIPLNTFGQALPYSFSRVLLAPCEQFFLTSLVCSGIPKVTSRV